MSQTVLVTGAASGIGCRLVDRFLARGDRVMAADVASQALAEQALRRAWPESRCLQQALDVRKPEAWDQALARLLGEWGHLDILLNVAGVLKPGYAHEAPAEAVDWHLDINAKGSIFGSQAAARAMIKRPHGGEGGCRGHIINMVSLAGIAGVPGLSLYTASKFAIRGFSLALAAELLPHQIYVTSVCPDLVRTPMLDLQLGYDEAALSFSGSTPLTTDAVCDAILGEVLEKRPVELVLPKSRGYLAKIVNFAPEVSRHMLPWLRQKGEDAQRILRGG